MGSQRHQEAKVPVFYSSCLCTPLRRDPPPPNISGFPRKDAHLVTNQYTATITPTCSSPFVVFAVSDAFWSTSWP